MQVSQPGDVSEPGELRTLWLMVAIQFFMTLSFTVLSPVMPLFLPDLGVHGQGVGEAPAQQRADEVAEAAGGGQVAELGGRLQR